MTDKIIQEQSPQDEVSFDALELVDALGVLTNHCKNDAFPPMWVRNKIGLIAPIYKASIVENEDGEKEIYLDYE